MIDGDKGQKIIHAAINDEDKGLLQIKNILIIGGNSKSAIAFRGKLANDSKYSLITIVRTPTPPFRNEKVVCVTDYFHLPLELFNGRPYVVYFVGSSKGPMQHLFAVNTYGPEKLARQARNAGSAGFLYISSLSVYGGAESITSTTPLCPNTNYGISKLTGEKLIAALETDDFAVTVLRAPILYSRKYITKLHIISRLIQLFRIFPIRQGGIQRSVLHTDNLAVCLQYIIENRLSGIHFSEDQLPFSYERLAEAIYLQRGRRIKIFYFPKKIFDVIRFFLPSRVFSSVFQNCKIEENLRLPVQFLISEQECISSIV